ncbi:PREDICTED: acid trehalase-like protein 1 isoform X2 [Priapulus caudatus]|uniref:Acid trehalase-like protein 1 isoform X2 n=1 Tax=Priapulus caudatus TaxID=37621 RepID=A0ABM1EMK1_PRICU|nr:PREDICTED: acid trehalase-like protein 1 isoform X2 [Priapulus caudatus]
MSPEQDAESGSRLQRHKQKRDLRAMMNFRVKKRPMLIACSAAVLILLVLHGSDRLCWKQWSIGWHILPLNLGELSEEATVFRTTRLPDDLPRHMATVGNGFLGHVVYADNIYVNGVYNGARGDSHRARVPSTCALRLAVDGHAAASSSYALDVGKGVFTETVDHEDFKLEYRIFAHRKHTKLLVCQVSAEAKKPGLVLLTKNNHGNLSVDFDIIKDVIKGATREQHLWTKVAEEIPGSEKKYLPPTLTDVYLVYDEVPERLELQQGHNSWTWITAIYIDEADAMEAYVEGHAMTPDVLYDSHVAGWREIWDTGRIDVEGDTKLAQIIYGCFYYLYSSLPTREDPKWSFYGLSPGSLSHGAEHHDYQGHIFWDQETWMYPPILMMQPQMSRLQLKIRLEHLQEALNKAQNYSYSGAMFPWESAYTGEDVCPWYPGSALEQHVTGDIAFAFWQYMHMNTDKTFINSAKDLIMEIANFWESRALYNKTKERYEIHDVMGPDEWHYPVNNSCYTNTIAQISLRLPSDAFPDSPRLKQKWIDIADHMYVPFDAKRNYHPQHDGYDPDERDYKSKINSTIPEFMVKQADVVLLGFPLMQESDEVVRRNDLVIYEDVTSVTGPAMTWGMFAIAWLELRDYKKAAELLVMNQQYTVEPFKVWSETPGGGGAVNFITGMGGFLQTVIFGYGGFRIRSDKLDFEPVLPPGTTKLVLTHLDYKQGSFTFTVTKDVVSVSMLESGGQGFALYVYETEKYLTLKVGKPLHIPRVKTAIVHLGASKESILLSVLAGWL